MWRNAWIHIFVVILVALAALLLIRMHNAAGADEGVSAGHRLAEAWCRDCHAIEAGRAPGRGPDFAAIANRPSTTELSLKVFFRTSHENMPNIVIAPDQADDLARYILSLRRS